MNCCSFSTRYLLPAGLLLLHLAGQAALFHSEPAAPTVRWQSLNDRWSFTIQFDHAPTLKATDQHVDRGYYYLDCYQEKGPAEQADWPFKLALITHVRRVYYPEQKVLRFIFYVPRASTMRLERTTPDPTTCVVTIRPLTPQALAPAPTLPTPVVNEGPLRKMVVIDPGHGGWPTEPGVSEGAQTTRRFSSRTYHEKDITLEIGKYLEQYVKSAPNLQATMTRREDVYVTLEDRIKFANEAKGDLFISIHLNATSSRRKTARGFEIFYLSDESKAVDRQLVAMDNDEKVHLDQKDSSGETLRELLRLLANEKFPEIQTASRDLCNVINEQFRLAGPFRGYNRGVKSAAFRVLLNFNMPAALAECGFLDNTEDARQLIKAETQKQIAALLFNGINRYFAVVDPKFTPHMVKVE